MIRFAKTLLRRAFTRPAPMPQPGEPAPSFELRDHTGTVRKLSDYAGQRVVLWFYPVADTPG
jgi:peroxiredoxin Q/BCP